MYLSKLAYILHYKHIKATEKPRSHTFESFQISEANKSIFNAAKKTREKPQHQLQIGWRFAQNRFD